MEGLVAIPDWLQYSAFGLLVLVLSGVYMLLREYLKRVEDRMEKSSDFTQEIVRNALDIQREGISTMQEMTASVHALGKLVEVHIEEARSWHAARDGDAP